jgi:hypothetical protein
VIKEDPGSGEQRIAKNTTPMYMHSDQVQGKRAAGVSIRLRNAQRGMSWYPDKDSMHRPV